MSMKSKIAALLRKAQSSNFEHESQTFLTKARALMEEHQIEFAEGEPLDESDGNHFSTRETREFEPGTPSSVKYELESDVARFFGCQIIWRETTWGPRGFRRVYDIHGTGSALTVTELMFPFIWKQVNDLAAKHSTSPASRRRLQRDISRSLRVRMTRIKALREQELHRAPAGSRELVLVGLSEALQDYVKGKYDQEVIYAKAPKLKPPSVLSRVLANEVSLDHQVGDQTNPGLQIR